MDNVIVNADDDIVTCVTTHFSEYMLVDKEEWYSVWTQASEYVPTYAPCDIAIVSDATASRVHYWTKGLGLINYENGFIEGENIAYGYFNADGAKRVSQWAYNETELDKIVNLALYFHLYTHQALEKDNDGLYGEGFELMVEIFSDEYYQILNSNNPKVVFFTYDGYLLETEEQNQKVADSLEKLKRMGVVIYAVSETEHTNTIIENAAIESGGEHWNAVTDEEIEQIWSRLHKAVSDPEKDSDGDGLSDNYEIQGMRIQNGRVITTDPNNPDTDGDDRTDGEEMGEQVKITVEVNGEGIKQNFTVFKMVSNPNIPDTLSGGFIYVDSLDYMPECEPLYNRIYIDEVEDVVSWTGEQPYDRNGQPIYGLANLHNSLDFSLYGEEKDSEYDNSTKMWLIYTKWLLAANIAKQEMFILSLPAQLFEHFLLNSGTTYYYDGTQLNSSMAKTYMLTNLYYIKQECVNNLKVGETKYIATAPQTELGAMWIDAEGGIAATKDIITNLTAHLAVNSGSAVIVTECYYDGKEYVVKFRYFILDYYDWNSEDYPDLYALNLYGISNTFLSVGEVTGYATFTRNSEITICVTPF